MASNSEPKIQIVVYNYNIAYDNHGYGKLFGYRGLAD